jgi:plastocyanin
MNRIRRSACMAASGLMLTAVAACGSSSSAGAPAGLSGGTGAVPKNTVIIKNFMFMPSNLSVSVGTKVKFINEDSTPHTVVGSGPSAFIKSGDLSQNQTYSVTFTKAGAFDYICSIHPYMKGTVTVH